MPGVSFSGVSIGRVPIGGCCPAIQTTRANMLTLISGSTVAFPRTYIITDIADAGAEFLSTSTSTINPVGVAYFYLPDDTVAGNYYGQLYSGAVVAAGQRWVWGNSVWQNVTGNVGSLANNWALGADWTELARTTANGYVLQQFICTYDIANNKFTNLKQFSSLNEHQISAYLQTASGTACFNNQWKTVFGIREENYGVIANNVHTSATDLIYNNVTVDGFSAFAIVSLNRLSGTSSIASNTVKASANRDYIKGNVLTGADILSNDITNGNIASNTATASIIENNTVSESDLNSNTLTGDSDISGNTVEGASDLNSNTLDAESYIRYNVLNSTAQLNSNNLDNASFITGNTVRTGTINTNILDNASSIVNNDCSQGNITNNDITAGGNITENKVGSTCTIDNNTISGAVSVTPTIPQIAYCDLGDNCTINNNTLSGDGAAIWDVFAGENCSVNGNTLSGDDTGTNILIADIVQTQDDHVDDNTLSGNNTRIESIHQLGNSSIDTCTLAEASCKIRNIVMIDSTITGCSWAAASGATGLDNIALRNFELSGVEDINVTNCTFENSDNQSAPNLDLVGWTHNIDGLSMVNGKGSFAFEYDFAANPLNSGNSAYFGFFEINSIGTRITISPNGLAGGAGATLRVGIENDDVDWGFAATDITLINNTDVTTISNQCLGRNRLQLTAGVANITAGTLRIWVEYDY